MTKLVGWLSDPCHTAAVVLIGALVVLAGVCWLEAAGLWAWPTWWR